MNETREYLIDNEVVTENEIELIESINGVNEKTYNDILFARTGYRNIEQIEDEE